MEVNDELAVLRRAIPAAIEAIGVGGRVVVEALPLPGGPAGQAGVHRGSPAARSPRTCRSCPAGARAGLPARHPGRREGVRRRDRGEPARAPRSGCAPLERVAHHRPEEQHREQPGRPDPLPRCRASPRRRSACPAHASSRGRRVRAARMPFVAPGDAGARSAGWSGCCSSTPPCSRRPSPPRAWRTRPARSPPASSTCRCSSSGCATPSTSPQRARRMGMVTARQPGLPAALRRQGPRHPAPPRPGAEHPDHPLPAPKVPAVLDPAPTYVDAPAEPTDEANAPDSGKARRPRRVAAAGRRRYN